MVISQNEIALLNHVSAYVGQNLLCRSSSGHGNQWLGSLCKKSFYPSPFSIAYWQKKEISREYWAQVDGHINSKELVFKDKIGRDRHDRRKRIVDTKNGQYAETHVSRLKQLPNKTSLIRCKLKTGRTHQIRVHLSHHNFPILGDPLYNSKSRTSRLMLHAFRLSFTHPLTLEKLSFTTLSDTFEKELKKNG